MPLTDSNPVIDGMRRDAAAARDWRYVGFKIFNIQHPFYPFDPVVVRQFRRDIDPSFMPLWVRHVWRSQAGGDHTFDYHLLSYEDPNWEKVSEESKLNPPHPDFRNILHGLDRPIRRPHGYISILHSKSLALSRAFSRKIIGAFWPLSTMHVHKYKEITYWNERIDREHASAEDLSLHASRIRAIEAKWQSESDYRWDHDWAHIAKQVQALTPEERAFVTQGTRARGHSIGHVLPRTA